VPWGTFWRKFVFLWKKNFLSSFVEAKIFQSSNRPSTTEILKQKLSRPGEHFQEDCFSTKEIWFRMFSFEIWQKKFRNAAESIRHQQGCQNCIFHVQWNILMWNVLIFGENEISNFYSDCPEELLRKKSFFEREFFQSLTSFFWS